MVEPDDDVAATTVFPVILYDGDREMNVGNISIHPDLVYKAFQIKLSEMTGISYNNLTTYLVDSKKSNTSPDRRKILITGKVNFAVIIRETNCYFFVVLKRSRRDRRRRPGKQSDQDFCSPDDLLRINRNHHDFNSRYYHDDRFHDLMMRGENYMNVIINSPMNVNFPRIEDAYPSVQTQSKLNRSMCGDCTVSQKQGKSPEFHLCVYDEVVVGRFRSPAGPICRPR